MKNVALIALFLAAGCEQAVPAARAEPAKEPKRPEKRPTEHPVGLLRDVISTTMDEHRTSMDEVLRSALMLNFGQAEQAALRIARTSPLPASAYQIDPTEPHLPAEFFAAQNELRVRANELARAAGQKDRRAMTRAFGRVTEACMQCHSLFVDPTKE